ncbi:MAG TPA: response regulator transcription factor [Bryobacteraceae bacterium]|nr:response regulator transcription factor [Bryobacteraceae bacterium]
MTETSGTILIVDDDAAIRQALRSTLQASRFNTEEATDGEQAISLMRAKRFDVILLDLSMPGMGGLATCVEARRLAPAVSILMLTVRDSQEEIIGALDAGADDYITKPFHVRELTARLRACVRRVRAGYEKAIPPITIGDIELDPARRTLKKQGQPVHLTPKEFDLLHYLMSHAGSPVAHSRLLRAVWGPEYGDELEYLRTFIRQLRRKIEDQPAAPTYLLTDPYVGYRFGEPSNAAQPQSAS